MRIVQNKRSILQGCNIVFSGVFPIVQGKNYESHYLWRLSVELGAAPSMTMTNFPLTHLVIHPDRLGTQKHVQVSGYSIHITRTKLAFTD